jgi:transposase
MSPVGVRSGPLCVVPRVRALLIEPTELGALASEMADVTLLQTVPGVGVITATALVALVADIRRFPSGRHFASFLGLTPKEDSSGSRRRLGAISNNQPRRSARVKALRPPSAVRCAQP